MAPRGRVHELFIESRSSAGSRSIMGMIREEVAGIGRFTVSRLMEELGLIRKQPGRLRGRAECKKSGRVAGFGHLVGLAG